MRRGRYLASGRGPNTVTVNFHAHHKNGKRMRILKYSILLLTTFTAGPTVADPTQGTVSQDSTRREGELRNDAYLKLAAGKYVDLERDYAVYLGAYLEGKMSEEDISLKFEAFSKALGLDTNFDAWVNAYPSSYSARLARGLYRVFAAWERRGDKFSNETTDEQFKGFAEALKQATVDLDDSIKLYSKPIWSYTALIRVSRGLGLGPDSSRRRLDEALKIDPRAFLPRLEYQTTLTPKWHGSVRLMEKFLTECKKSLMSTNNKERIEAKHHFYLGEKAQLDKDYKKASNQYFEAYRHDNDPYMLFQSGQAALDGSLYDLSFQRFDGLVRLHPKYPYGYNKRGWIYEDHFKNDEKAFNDYLVAAELGNSFAQNRVGWWYMTGKFVAKDYFRAEVYLKRAADQKNNTAIINLTDLNELRKATGQVK